jgi:Family of unknown function (DUF5681)
MNELEIVKGSRWKKGKSGNPAGRPVSAPTATLAAILRERVARQRVALIDQLISLALTGQAESTRLQAIKLLFDRSEGTPTPAPGASKAIDKLTVEYVQAGANDRKD